MANSISSNRRIAKNTIALYVRMLFAMIVSLYTSRIVLDILGESDYGIYNVVGGVVMMFVFLSNTLASASQRYFAFELGRNNYERLKKIFSLTLVLYVIVIFIIVVIAETIGLWFVNEKMIIPAERVRAANWVFQLSIISFCITIFTTPYQAIIIAREQMNVYAFAGIFEAILHLSLVLFLKFFIHNCDSLIAYGFVMLAYKCFSQAIYVFYSKSKYEESSFTFCWDGPLAKEMLSYSSWNIFGGIANVCRSQGINMLISMFFAPAINAARGIAYQVNNALNVFATNFYTAVRPQITKRYAADNMQSTMNLVFSSSKFTFFLLAFVSIPMLVHINPILDIWLVTVPDSAALFTKLVIIVALIDSLSNPLMTLMQATGHVKYYQLITGGLVLMNLPFSYIFLRLGYSAAYTMYVAIAMAILCLISRLLIVKHYVGFSIRQYARLVLFRTLIVSVASLGLSYSFHLIAPKESSVVVTLSLLLLSVIGTIGVIFFLGLDKNEKHMVVHFIQEKLNAIKH